jgi:hypothetical protein
MQVIGFNLKKISAEKKKAPEGKIEVKSNVDIKEVAKEKVELFKDSDAIKFDFVFSVDYAPNAASIIFEGIVLITTDKAQASEIMKKWKTKKIPEEVRVPIFNLILAKCNLKALQLEDELGLPMHVPLPRVQLPKNDQGYVQ